MTLIPALLLLFLSVNPFSVDPEPFLKSAPMPFYPSLARAARVQGKVLVHFRVDEKGDTCQIEIVSGHAILRQATIDNVKEWKFAWPQPCACRVQKEVLFDYILLGKTPDSPTTIVKWFGNKRVEIETDAPLIADEVSSARE